MKIILLEHGEKEREREGILPLHLSQKDLFHEANYTNGNKLLKSFILNFSSVYYYISVITSYLFLIKKKREQNKSLRFPIQLKLIQKRRAGVCNLSREQETG